VEIRAIEEINVKGKYIVRKTPSGKPLDSNLRINETLAEKTDELDSGAISRGILVFVALSCLFILYVGIKTCR